LIGMPVRSDYLLRLVQQLARVIARLMELRGARRYDEGLALLDETTRQFFGVDLRLATMLALPDLLALLRDKHGSTARSAELLAEILLHDAELRRDSGDAGRAAAALQRGAALVLSAADRPDVTPDEIRQASQLAGQLRRAGAASLGAEDVRRMAELHERALDYGAAEDALFLLRTRREAEPDATTRSRAFYERLLARTDEELERGGLPRDEVREGLESLVA
jgi:hypothetical protein